MSKTLLLLYTAGKQHLDNLQKIGADWKILHTTDKSTAKMMIEHAEVVMGNHHLCESLPFNKQQLKWVQTNSVGIDFILNRCGNSLHDIIFTNARGAYNDEISEHTIALILSLHRNLHLLRDAQQEHIWQRPQSLGTLKEKKVLIIGYGSLGKAIGEKLQIFGCIIFGVNRSSQYFSINNQHLHWKELLPVTDIIVLALPYTSDTINYLGKNEIETLSEQAIVVNVGRAGTIDESTLYQQLKTGKLRGAALDVFEGEPLLPEHIAWDIKNLFVSPHTARSRESSPPFQFETLFEENFKRYVNGEPLLNVVDIEKGY